MMNNHAQAMLEYLLFALAHNFDLQLRVGRSSLRYIYAPVAARVLTPVGNQCQAASEGTQSSLRRMRVD